MGNPEITDSSGAVDYSSESEQNNSSAFWMILGSVATAIIATVVVLIVCLTNCCSKGSSSEGGQTGSPAGVLPHEHDLSAVETDIHNACKAVSDNIKQAEAYNPKWHGGNSYTRMPFHFQGLRLALEKHSLYKTSSTKEEATAAFKTLMETVVKPLCSIGPEDSNPYSRLLRSVVKFPKSSLLSTLPNSEEKHGFLFFWGFGVSTDFKDFVAAKKAKCAAGANDAPSQCLLTEQEFDARSAFYDKIRTYMKADAENTQNPILKDLFKKTAKGQEPLETGAAAVQLREELEKLVESADVNTLWKILLEVILEGDRDAVGAGNFPQKTSQWTCGGAGACTAYSAMFGQTVGGSDTCLVDADMWDPAGGTLTSVFRGLHFGHPFLSHAFDPKHTVAVAIAYLHTKLSYTADLTGLSLRPGLTLEVKKTSVPLPLGSQWGDKQDRGPAYLTAVLRFAGLEDVWPGDSAGANKAPEGKDLEPVGTGSGVVGSPAWHMKHRIAGALGSLVFDSKELPLVQKVLERKVGAV